MAYYDRIAAARKKESADKYAELKEYITSKDDSGKICEWFLALEHMTDLENQISEQKKQINEYRDFFSLLKNLLPNNNLKN